MSISAGARRRSRSARRPILARRLLASATAALVVTRWWRDMPMVRLKPDTTSAPELTQVMIHVQVGPAHPVCVGHIAKDGVRRSEAAFPRRDQLDEHLELRHVGGEVRRL